MAVYPDQAFFSKKPVRKPEDFKGLKTRVHSVALASLVAGLGGEPLTIAFAEVYTALERGTLDAAISGTKPGYGLRWYEVSKYLVGPISMRPHVALAINKRHLEAAAAGYSEHYERRRREDCRRQVL